MVFCGQHSEGTSLAFLLLCSVIHSTKTTHFVVVQEHDEEHLKDFIPGKNFRDHLRAMRQDRCFGTHIEIQAMAEVYCRPVEIFKPQSPDEPLRPLEIFQGTSAKASAPIRLLFVNDNHFDAILDPQHPSVGVGLGVCGLEDAPAVSLDKKTVDRVMQESERDFLEKDILQAMLDSSADEQVVQAAIRDSEQEQLQDDIEKQVIQQSFVDFVSQIASQIQVPSSKKNP